MEFREKSNTPRVTGRLQTVKRIQNRVSSQQLTVSRKSSICCLRHYLYSSLKRHWNFLGVGGFCKIKTFKEMYKACLESTEGWRGLRIEKKITSMWEVHVVYPAIFSGTTQCFLR